MGASTLQLQRFHYRTDPVGHAAFRAADRTELWARFIRLSVAPLVAGLVILFLSFLLPDSLATNAKTAIAITALAIVGWTLTPIPDSIVAVAAALLLVLTGVLPEKQLYSALGKELIWLLIAAFIIAAVVKNSGLAERLAFAAVQPFTNVTAFFHAIAFVIALTAFLIPSTSGRAALLLPVFTALADRMPGSASRRALAILFPTVILLSAGGSLIGAGAHFIAVETIHRSGGPTIGYVEWLMLAFPTTLLTSHLAVAVIIAMFVPESERESRLSVHVQKDRQLSGRQWRIAIALAIIVLLWIAAPWHGVDIALVAMGGAALLINKPFTSESPKQLFRGVETELLVFLAATVVIADGIMLSGASQWMAERIMDILPQSAAGSTGTVIAFMTGIAVLSHLVINSRSARAAVLLPAITLPLAGLGHDTTILVLVTVLGTGFCQTLMASAKPVTIFGSVDGITFTQSDLLRLAVALLPIKALIIVCFALFVWPHQTTSNPPAAPAIVNPTAMTPPSF